MVDHVRNGSSQAVSEGASCPSSPDDSALPDERTARIRAHNDALRRSLLCEGAFITPGVDQTVR